MAFENEEDYLDNLLKSITSEDNGDSGEDLTEADSEIQMPETFDNSQEDDLDGDVFERLLSQQEEELHSDEEKEQPTDEDVNFMEALFGNQQELTGEEEPADVFMEEEPETTQSDEFLQEETESEEMITEDESISQMQDIEVPEIEDNAIPVIENEEFQESESAEIPEAESMDFSMADNDELPDDEELFAAADEELPEMEDVIIPEVDDEAFAGDFADEMPEDISQDITADEESLEDLTQYPDGEDGDLDIGNELIGQIDGLFNDVEEELEEEGNADTFGMMTEEDAAFSGSMEEAEPEVDYSNLEVDDELKELLGVESAEQLADIPSESEGLSENELVKLAQMESAASFEMDSDNEKDALNTTFALENDFDNGDQEVLEAGQTGERGKNNKTKAGFIAKLLSIFKKKNGDTPEGSDGNENQKVLDELFDENGELLDDDKKIKKKGLFFKSGKKKADGLESGGEDDEDEDDIESPEEIARKEEKARKKKEKKEKKEKEKQEKKEKKEQKPKKEKKPKVKKEKPPVNPADLIHVKPVAIIIMAVIVAGIVGYVYFFVSSFNYNNAMDRAAYYMADKRYTNAYRAVSGIEMKKEEDIALKEQIVTIMYVQHYYDAYERYLKVDLQFEALDSLIQGVRTYDLCYPFAIEQGITGDYEIVKAKLVAALEQYGITEEMARTYGTMMNYTQYKYILEGYGGVSNDSGN